MPICLEHPNAERNRERRQKKKDDRAKLTNYQRLQLWTAKLARKNAVGVFVAPADITRWEDGQGSLLCFCHGRLTFRRNDDGSLECVRHLGKMDRT